MMKNETIKIGMIDSGVGGLSILSEVNELLPDLEVYYIADTKLAPYGEKSERELIARAIYLTDLLLEEGVQLITLACNTLTAAAIKTLRQKYRIPFVGVEPYLNAFNREIKLDNLGRLGVLTTKYTGKSGKFWQLKNKLDPENKIHHQSSDKLAMLIERIYESGFDKEKEELIKKELFPLKNKGFSHIILGCTHYPLISSFIEDYLGVKCIAPGKHIALRIKDILETDLSYKPQGKVIDTYWYFDTLKDIWTQVPHGQIQLVNSDS